MRIFGLVMIVAAVGIVILVLISNMKDAEAQRLDAFGRSQSMIITAQGQNRLDTAEATNSTIATMTAATAGLAPMVMFFTVVIFASMLAVGFGLLYIKSGATSGGYAQVHYHQTVMLPPDYKREEFYTSIKGYSRLPVRQSQHPIPTDHHDATF